MKMYCIDTSEHSPKLELYKEYDVYSFDKYQYTILDPNDQNFLTYDYKEKFTTLDILRDMKLKELGI